MEHVFTLRLDTAVNGGNRRVHDGCV
jgi:hypothetical protein